ncbi:hypothetical protein Cagg_2498 [Chloroflexus aggregans DSM 9485]|uniref:Uncharacterized protein n=1 Tax=Chloroflexus aggregans (strain MD-66 / DSM 9485) TaxID=326427 RepID=B8G3W7_CHLAD|nr:hypothetical protein Cagg_2498 [Chloroflexus aggregans DSM 9485]
MSLWWGPDSRDLVTAGGAEVAGGDGFSAEGVVEFLPQRAQRSPGVMVLPQRAQRMGQPYHLCALCVFAFAP